MGDIFQLNKSEELESHVQIYELQEFSNLLLDQAVFYNTIKSYFEIPGKGNQKSQIQKLLNCKDWCELYVDKVTKRRVLSESRTIEYPHELETAIKVTQVNYDVLFAPKCLFKPYEKKFDILLLRDSIMLRAEMKMYFGGTPTTLAKRIVEGSRQASRVIIDIRSSIPPNFVVEGLRSSCYKNDLLREILLFYRGKFYLLPKSLINNKRIYYLIK